MRERETENERENEREENPEFRYRKTIQNNHKQPKKVVFFFFSGLSIGREHLGPARAASSREQSLAEAPEAAELPQVSGSLVVSAAGLSTLFPPQGKPPRQVRVPFLAADVLPRHFSIALRRAR